MKTITTTKLWVVRGDFGLNHGDVRVHKAIPSATSKQDAVKKFRVQYPNREPVNVKAKQVRHTERTARLVKRGVMIPHGWPNENPYWKKILDRQGRN